MAKVKDILRALEDFAPMSRKADFDNCGLLAGFAENEVRRILVSLDITGEVIKEAAADGAQLIVSHHPIFFSLKSVTDGDLTGRRIISLLTQGISAICMHTNLDAADGGVNDALAETIGLTDTVLLKEEGVDLSGKPYSYDRVGCLVKPMPLAEYLDFVKCRLRTNGLRYHDAGRAVYKVAMGSGSRGNFLADALRHGCDTVLTGDIKYDVFLEAKEAGLNIIDGDHFCTENVVMPVLEKRLLSLFPEVRTTISKVHGQTARFA